MAYLFVYIWNMWKDMFKFHFDTLKYTSIANVL